MKLDGAAAPTAASSLPRLLDRPRAVVDVTGEVTGVVDVAGEAGGGATVFDDDPQAAATSTKAAARTAAQVGVVVIPPKGSFVCGHCSVGPSRLFAFGARSTHSASQGDKYGGRVIQNDPCDRGGMNGHPIWAVLGAITFVVNVRVSGRRCVSAIRTFTSVHRAPGAGQHAAGRRCATYPGHGSRAGRVGFAARWGRASTGSSSRAARIVSFFEQRHRAASGVTPRPSWQEALPWTP